MLIGWRLVCQAPSLYGSTLSLSKPQPRPYFSFPSEQHQLVERGHLLLHAVLGQTALT